jgi:hypothetical protein
MADLFVALLATGWAILLFAPFQMRRADGLPWLPFGLGGGLTRVWAEGFSVRLAWVPA